MQKPKRKLKAVKINRLEELPLRLAFPLALLQEVAAALENHYKSGLRKIGKKERLIFSGDRLLRKIHTQIDRMLLDRFDVPEEIQGGISGRSTRTNAERHIGKKNLAHHDLSNFYPSVSSGRVYGLFVSLGCEPESARLLARLTTAQGHLPQGFSTSPKIAALILLRANSRIKGLVAPRGVAHSFWVDDLVLSGDYPLEKLAPGLKKIIEEEGFAFNDKTSYSSRNERQVATGGVVNVKLGVPKERVRDMRRTLHRIKVMGLEPYRVKFSPDMDLDHLKQKISGDLGYMMSLNPERYRSFQEEWKKLKL